MKRLNIEPLTCEAFVPFGQVIETDGRDHFAINGGSTQRFHNLAQVDLARPDDRAIISIFRASRLDYPLPVRMLERHPLGSQAFVPLDRQRFLLVVAPAGDTPDPESVRAFITNGQQGVNYAQGVWHHPILALEDNSDFLIVDRSGAGQNCDEAFFEPGDIRLLDAAALLS